jgi:hypothetical protein
MTFESKDWDACKAALVKYFTFETPETAQKYDTSTLETPYADMGIRDLDYLLIVTFFTMLDKKNWSV